MCPIHNESKYHLTTIKKHTQKTLARHNGYRDIYIQIDRSNLAVCVVFLIYIYLYCAWVSLDHTTIYIYIYIWCIGASNLGDTCTFENKS